MNRSHNSRRPLLGSWILAVVALGTGLMVPGSAAANDRDLLSASSGRPYVFVLLDTSGSMNWAPKCTAAQVAAGICTFQCDTGDCPVPRDGDDPASKFRQSKEALHQVLSSVSNIDFGFATYNQDQLGVRDKHWLYQVHATQAGGFHSLSGGIEYPAAGSQDVFGATLPEAGISCDRGTGDAEIACYGNTPADLNDTWEVTRSRRVPKLGRTGNQTVTVYIRTPNNTRYEVQYQPIAANAPPAASFNVNVRTQQCNNAACSTFVNGTTVTKSIQYDVVGDFVMWDFQIQRASNQGGYFGYQDSNSGGTCNGWDLNTDTASDKYPNSTGYSLRFPTPPVPNADPATPDRTPAGFLDYGDRIPLDWTQDNKSLVMSRFSPDGGSGDSFAGAHFLADQRLAGQAYLRLKDENVRPLFPTGATPLGFSLGTFRDWYCQENNPSRACKNGGGWLAIAQNQDPNWGCRQKYLLVVTDGDDTCPGRDPCSYTASLRAQTGILTYVVAFGVENTPGNKLNCMAANGGTGDPIYPQNKQELVDALTDIFARILERTSTFASAAVPSVQATVADKIYLSSFTPVSGAPIWSGRLDAFLRPLPLAPDGSPDRTKPCSSAPTQASCFLWDAADQQATPPGYSPSGLLLQAPTPAEVAGGSLMLGNTDNERRLFYHLDATLAEPQPGNRRLFTYQPPLSDYLLADLVRGLKTGDPLPWTTPAERATALQHVKDTINFTIKEKNADITNPNTGTTYHIDYLMGDIFHSDPVVQDNPSKFNYYSADVYNDASLCTPGTNPDPPHAHSQRYRDFADRNSCRRKLLMVGANDGQLHVFDGGIFRGTDCRLNDGSSVAFPTELATSAEIDGAFDNGTGKELFAFMPRAVLPIVNYYAQPSTTRWAWSMDGTVRTDDVYIDARGALAAGFPDCLEREWRTVALGGMREGGRAYFALDVSQPDVIDATSLVPQPDGTYVPSCLDPSAACGTQPFPTVLWEFTDDPLDSGAQGVTTHGKPMDEDGVGGADLGFTWSVPTTGRIRICTANCGIVGSEISEDRFVAVFGGGLGSNPGEATGNWLYIVDIETGQVIYKRAVLGSVPTTVAAVDADQDTYLDTAYFGTTAGYLYKVNLGGPRAPLPLDSTTIQDFSVLIGGVPTSRVVERIIDNRAKPFRVFQTGGRPIYEQPAVFFAALQRKYGISFGTGNRWDLWDSSGQTGRFYTMLDTGWQNSNPAGTDLADAVCGGCPTPLNETQYQAVDPELPYAAATPEYLLDITDPTPGWYLTLLADEKSITEPIAISGISSFTSYLPVFTQNADGTCSKTGSSRIFVVDTRNANPYVFPDAANPNDRVRYWMVSDFTTQPFRESSTTKNPECVPGSPGCAIPPGQCTTAAMSVIKEELKRLLPPYCKFASYSMDIKTIRSDTGLVCIAPIPICIAPRNWKEFSEAPPDAPAMTRDLNP